MDLIQALDKIDELKKQKITGYLHNTLIEGVYDKKGVLVEGLWEWHVRTACENEVRIGTHQLP